MFCHQFRQPMSGKAAVAGTLTYCDIAGEQSSMLSGSKTFMACKMLLAKNSTDRQLDEWLLSETLSLNKSASASHA
jgi:hypothetical protein